MENKGSQRHMPSGWNRNGLETFNKLAKEVLQDRKKHGVEFDKAFKRYCEEAKMSCTNTTRKRKINYVDTYSDLHGGEAIENEEEHSESDGDDAEKWAAKNVFVV